MMTLTDLRRRPLYRYLCQLGLAFILLLLMLFTIAVGFKDWTMHRDVWGPAQATLIALADTCGLIAAMLLMTQFFLSARLQFLDAAVGAGRLMLLHRFSAIVIIITATAHPFLLYLSKKYQIGAQEFEFLVLLGALTLILLWTTVCTTVWRRFLEIPYHIWHRVHWIGFLAATLATIHALGEGPISDHTLAMLLWLLIFLLYLCCFVWVKFVRPSRLKTIKWVVDKAEPLNHNIVQLSLTCTSEKTISFLPGQYAMLSFHRSAVSREPHPFTISSSPHHRDRVTFTVKNSGDYTANLKSVKPGDLAAIEAPYGSFSHSLLNPSDTSPLLFIAGGIGITPMLSMLRYMQHQNDLRPVTLIWSNHHQQDIFCRDELDRLNDVHPDFTAHYIITQPPSDPNHNRLDQTTLERLLTPRDYQATVYLCGPQPMMRDIKHCLRRMSFPARRIKTENFFF